LRVAYFISPHGFGHAARATAVMAAVARRDPASRFEIFTSAPRWFFDDSLPGISFAYHELETDVGLVQRDPLREDLGATLERLRELVPFRPELLGRLAAQLHALRCDLVVCDVAPLGIATARAAGLPSILVENFTWDWIYEPWADSCPGLGEIAQELAEVFAAATLRIQTEPFCRPWPGARRVAPVSREPRIPRRELRHRLGIGEEDEAVLVTMGGIEWSYLKDTALEGMDAEGMNGEVPWLIAPGGLASAKSFAEPERRGRFLLLPHRSDFYHPDLVHATDGVIAKLGYSTVAEVDRAGLPLGYLRRPRFAESAVLEAWVREHRPSLVVDEAALGDPAALAGAARAVHELGPRPPAEENGADAVAEIVLRL